MGIVKTFEEFINEDMEIFLEDLLNEDFSQEEPVPEGMPEEFTGDPKTDPYLAAAIFKHNDDKVYYNSNYENVKFFEPFKKAQEEGNRYNEIWKSLVNWIKTDSEIQRLSVIEKDKILLSTFTSILQTQGSLNQIPKDTKQDWKVYNYNRCKNVWEKYTKLALKVYPGKNDSVARSEFRRKKYMDFIRKEGIEKYAKSWIPEFSRSYQV